MQKTYLAQIRASLENDYFNYLDNNQVRYLEYEKADQNIIITHIKDEYLLNDNQMAIELGFKDFAAYLNSWLQEKYQDDVPEYVETLVRELLSK